MGFRTIMIENNTSLRLQLDCMIVEIDGEDLKIPLADINTIVIDNLKITITTRMLSTFASNNILLIICDKNHMPIGELNGLNIHSRSTKVLGYQLSKSKQEIDALWTEIVQAKILNQIKVLEKLDYSADEINRGYVLLDSIHIGDTSNCEGYMARLYFRNIGGIGFTRNDEGFLLNAGLNYGYAIIRSFIARTCVGFGLNTQLGIHHKNEYNAFNLVDDMIEPFRAILDYFVINLLDHEEYFTPETRYRIVNFLNHKIKYEGHIIYMSSMIRKYVENFSIWYKDSTYRFEYPSLDNYIGEGDEI